MHSDQALRLNKQLALWLGVSRREADNMIADRRVKIDGEIAVLGQRIDERSTVLVDDKPINQTVEFVLIKFHKPVGYTCSRKQQGETPTIYELLPKELHHLKPVGRLDKDSSGLLLLTNNGDLAYQMTHPKFQKIKQYNVTLDRDLEPLHQQMINDYGVNLPDGRSQLTLTRLSDDNRRQWQVEMSEGRNRQIRRTFDSLGYRVLNLHRLVFGKYTIDDITSGEYKRV